VEPLKRQEQQRLSDMLDLLKKISAQRRVSSPAVGGSRTSVRIQIERTGARPPSRVMTPRVYTATTDPKDWAPGVDLLL
jgi:hypothetical protein